MNLNLFENLKKDLESNINVKSFIEELTNFLNNSTSSKTLSNQTNKNQEKREAETTGILPDEANTIEEKEKQLQEYRKEGHLYLVTEDRNNKVYLWDFTDKPKYEIEETNLSEELLKVAKEGAMLQYKNGNYELYTTDGYDMLYNEEETEK